MADGKKLPIQIVIGAVDEVTYKVMAINEKLKRISAPARQVGSAFSALGQESGLTELAKGLGEVGKGTKDVLDKLGDFGMKAAATIGIAGGAVYELMHGFSESGEEVGRMAKRLGMTTDAYQELAGAAKLADIDQESFNSSMTKFSRNMAEASVGMGESFVGFQALNIQLRDSHGKLRALDNVLPELADKMSKIHNASVRNAVAMKLFGREGAKLGDLFEGGSKGLAERMAKIRELGIMNPDQIKEAQEVGERFKTIGIVLQNVRNIIASTLGPAFEKLMDNLQGWFTTHREDIKKWANQFAQDLPGYIAQASQAFRDFTAAVAPVVSVVKWLADTFGGVNVALAALFTYLGGFGLVGSIVKLAWSFKGILGPALRVAWVFGGMLVDTLMGIAAGFAAIVGWPVVIAAALGGLAVLLYNKWQPFHDLIDSIWGKLKDLFGFGSDVNVTQTTQSAPGTGWGASSQLNPWADTLDNSSRMPANKQEAELRVIFDNMPKGSRVETKKADMPIDTTMGYSYPAVGHG